MVNHDRPHQNDQGDWVCEHGTAMDVHCCNCHSGFLFDADSCVCDTVPPDGDELAENALADREQADEDERPLWDHR